jgi:dienelactone hydrolase
MNPSIFTPSPVPLFIMSSNKPIAGPHSDHCFTGVKHTGEPVGKTAEFGGLSTYVSEPRGEAKGIILFFADVFGPFFINNQLLQDYFADNGTTIFRSYLQRTKRLQLATVGFLVLGIDYFFGDGFHKHSEPDFDRNTWIEVARARADAETPKWLQAVREHYGTDKNYAAIGYCFGATYTLDLAGTDQVLAGELDCNEC